MTKFSKGQKVQPKGYEVATVVTGNENKAGEIMVEFSGGVRRWFRPEKLQPVKSDDAEPIGEAAARVVLDIETRSGVDLASEPDKTVIATIQHGKILDTMEIPSGLYEYQKAAYEEIMQQPSRMHRMPRRIGKVPELGWPYGAVQETKRKVPVRGWQAHLHVTGRADDRNAILTAQDRKERRMRANRRPI